MGNDETTIFSNRVLQIDMMPIFKKYSDKISDVLEKSLSWQVIKDDCVSIYMQTYTETELKGMLTFYKSPIGQSVMIRCQWQYNAPWQ